MTRATVLVNLEGEVWRFTPRQWHLYCLVGATDDDLPSPREYGAKSLGIVSHDVLDWRRSDYLSELECQRRETAKKKERGR